MPDNEFEGRPIGIIEFDDATSGERVIEFRDPQRHGDSSVMAVILNEGDLWEDASVSLNPDVDAVDVKFVLWAIGVAERVMRNSAS